MINSASRMPSRCSGAPEMPNDRYAFGLTFSPDLPTCRDFGSQPASITGRDADSGTPRASANSCTVSRSSFEPMPRPTETSIGAAVMSTSPLSGSITCWRLVLGESSPAGGSSEDQPGSPSRRPAAAGKAPATTVQMPRSPGEFHLGEDLAAEDLAGGHRQLAVRRKPHHVRGLGRVPATDSALPRSRPAVSLGSNNSRGERCSSTWRSATS